MHRRTPRGHTCSPRVCLSLNCSRRKEYAAPPRGSARAGDELAAGEEKLVLGWAADALRPLLDDLVLADLTAGGYGPRIAAQMVLLQGVPYRFRPLGSVLFERRIGLAWGSGGRMYGGVDVPHPPCAASTVSYVVRRTSRL